MRPSNKSKQNLVAAGLFLAAVSVALGQSTVQFTATSHAVAESAGAVTLTVQRQGDLNAEVRVDYATADGTAINGLKYAAVSGTLAFGAGETNKTIVVPIVNEGFADGSKTFRVTLSNPTGGAVLGARTTTNVSITDNDVGVQFVFAAYSVAEDASVALVGVVRGDDGTLPVTVDFATTDGTATNGLDYTGMTNTLSFAPTERLKLISVPILNNSLKEANKIFRLNLSNPTGGSLGSQRTTAVTLVDNDQGFQFEFASYTVVEDAGAVLISVLRAADNTNFLATVGYATADGSGTNGLEYTGTTNTLAFAPGEKVKLFTVPILNDGVTEAAKTFGVTLSNPTGGGVLGSRTTTTVSILDNDPGVGFELARYSSAWGNAGDFTMTVLRGNDWALGPITVDYVTSDLTGKAGEDYQAVSGTLEFKENETVKRLSIPVLRDRAVEGTKSFRVALTNATGGATLGRLSSTVNIVGAYFTLAPLFDPALAIRRDWGVNILAWTGGGQLQRADRVTGPWPILAAAQSPYTIQSPIPATFYRVTRPRPTNLYVPSTYDGQTPLPLVILLHGYGGSGNGEEDYMRLRALAEGRRFLYCYPDATIDLFGSRFWNTWNAPDASAFRMTNVDDVGYLRGLIEEIAGCFALDRRRVYLIGHSNGGFMAYRMACESADLITGIASVAGTTHHDPTRCAPSEPVNILHIHGTADNAVRYAGGAITSPPFPWNLPANAGVLQHAQTWAGYNGASNPLTGPRPSMDLDLAVPGLDTVVTRYMSFPPGGAVELWTINGGGHVPALSSEFSPRVIDWLLAHPKP